MKIKLVAADVQVFHIGGGFIGEGCEVMSSWKDATFGYLYSEISGVYLPEYSNDNDSLYLQGPKRCEIIFRLP